jgi:hypothetical protein
MHIAAQLDDRARMTLDAAGMHIRARTPCDTTMAWIDIPATAIENYRPEDPFFEGDIGINPDKICRMLYAYEPDDLIDLVLETHDDPPTISIRGKEGTLRTARPPLDTIKRIGILEWVQTRHPPTVIGDKDADIFRDWLRRADHDDGLAISFKHDTEHERYTLWAVSEASDGGCVLGNLTVPEGTNDLRTLISLDLLQSAIAPACISGDVKFAFGNDTPLYLETQVSGCGVVIAIAPRIESG